MQTVVKQVPVLRASSIYQADSVYRFKSEHLDFNQEMTLSYLEKATEVEESNLERAIYYVKRAITLQPALDYYKRLAGLLVKADRPEELLQLYQLILQKHTFSLARHGNITEFLFEKPDEATAYEYLTLVLLKQEYAFGETLSELQELGFSMVNLKERLSKDERLKLIPTSERYKSLMLYFLPEEELASFVRSEDNFQNLLSSIKDSASVFEIDKQEVAAFNYQESEMPEDYDGAQDIRNHYGLFLQEKHQQPKEWYAYNFKRKIKINDNVQAVVYAIDSSALASPVNMRHIYYRLVTYTRKGQLIGSEIVATQAGEHLSTASFQHNTFTVTDHTRFWKKPYQKDDFDNFLVKTEKVGERRFEILPDGKIVPAKAPVAPIDSTQVTASAVF
ncbi:hypothetical protein GCM10023183_00490 [Nibribacter koreensis]|uniref:Tetratricopeptide repeat protein n=1 Tax=Nibribacter koreensis TaxID=1084519 RepID=A0ABP8F4M4_9BACT